MTKINGTIMKVFGDNVLLRTTRRLMPLMIDKETLEIATDGKMVKRGEFFKLTEVKEALLFEMRIKKEWCGINP